MNYYKSIVDKNSPSFLEKLSFGFCAVCRDTVYMLVSGFFMLYLYSVCNLPMIFITVMFFTVRIIDALTDPIMGFVTDHFRSRMFGKFKPWILAGAAINSLFLIMMFNNPGLDSNALKVYEVFTYSLWALSYKINDIPFWGLIPTFGTDSQVRENMTAIARTGALIGGRIVIIVGLPTIYYLSVVRQYGAVAFVIFAAVTACLFVLGSIILIWNVKDRTPAQQERIRLSEAPSLIYKNSQLIVVFFLGLLQQIVLGLVNSSLTFFMLFMQDHDKLISVFMIPGGFAMLLAFVSFSSIIHLTSRRFVFVSSCLLMLFGYSCMIFLNYTSVQSINALSFAYCIASFGMAWSQASTTVMTADCVDYGEFRLNVRSEGLVFSIQTAGAKLGTSIALILSGTAMALVSYLPGAMPITSQIYSFRASQIIVCLLMVLMIFIYLNYYKLHGIFFQKVLDVVEQFKNGFIFNNKQQSPVRYALNKDAILHNLDADTQDEVINALIDKLDEVNALNSRQEFARCLKQKMELAPAGIALGIAIPHANGDFVRRAALAVATLKKPLDFGSPDGRKCDLVFLIAAPNNGKSHINLLGRLSLILNENGFPDKLRTAGSEAEIINRILKCEQHLII
ncbi:MAG: MFS transporter [Succinivibrio sp.]|nr:MFS transporter [Succinivibrio sp.]